MLTILIPTYANRSAFLNRIINYMVDCNIKYTILIADSSEPKAIDHNLQIIKKVESKLNIKYKIYPHTTEGFEKVTNAVNEIQTKYSLIAADDDFYIPSSIERSAAFLEDNSDYIVALGITASFELEGGYLHSGTINAFSCDSLNESIDQMFSYKRLLNHLKCYTPTIYGVHRTKQLQYSCKKCIELKLKDFRFVELFPSCLSVIQGKVKILDCLYLIRQASKKKKYEQYKTLPYLMPDWIADPDWSNSYKIFRKSLAENLVHYDRINIDDANKVIKIAVWEYLMSQNRPQCEDKRFSLQALLQKSSPYHNDFLPIYNSLYNNRQ